jgi:hypothetical protein
MVARKYLKALILFACAIALVLPSGSCKKEPEQPEPPKGALTDSAAPAPTQAPSKVPPVRTPKVSNDQLQPIPLVGLGPVTFGMSKEQVIELLGQPDRAEGRGIALYYLESRGLSLLLHRSLGLQTIDCWSKDYPEAPPQMTTFVTKTEKGIAMGASRKQIVAAYGKPDRTDVRRSFDILYYDQLQIEFMLANDKLINLKLKAPK